ncbi:MAG TPA: DUF5060 domain-containing protein [Chthonomonadaceae bacterium]|nr:DUF5060 domain-containing protein [Chthonomonadaceae bacterium]
MVRIAALAQDLRAVGLILFLLLLALLIAGCGGTQDYGNFPRDLSGDIAPGYNTSLGGRYGGRNGGPAGQTGLGVYPHIETSFQLASVPGDPFDYEQVNVQVTLRKPDGSTVDVPAFFDGGTTWRMRFTPTQPGQYAVASVKLNRQTAHEQDLDPKEWTVSGETQPGFIRIDPGDHRRFVFDNGGSYFPLGQDQGWRSQGLPDIPDLFAKMHAAGETWSRVWMTFWDSKSLDWPASGKPAKLGDIDLAAAKRWDAIVDAAAKNDIYFQLVFQNHGSYSSTVDSNWKQNPYNVANGGFLHSPEEFFTNPQARTFTRRKLYYMLARWGYSPNIMAFELFNEVENTDAAHDHHWDDVAMWHREMALFLRRYDGYQHLVTTSALPGVPPDNPVWQTVDYLQAHDYPSDIITTLGGPPSEAIRKLNKPVFVGEFGASNLQDPEGIFLHEGVWASLMSGMSGAAEYWDWDNVEKNNLYGEYKPVQGYLDASGLPGRGNLMPMNLTVETAQRAALRFGPGGGWETAKENEFVVGTSGPPAGIGHYPAFLQGQGHRDMTPKPLTFQVAYPQAGTFAVSVGQVAKAGAHLKLSVDGHSVEQDYPAADKDYTPKSGQETLSVDVPAGAHTVTVENTGKDWVVIREFTLSNYASALAANARAGQDYVAAWVYNRDNLGKKGAQSTAAGTLRLPALKPGKYQATWWDTYNGKALDTTDLTVTGDKEAATLSTPPIANDVALYVVRAGTNTASTEKKKRGEKSARSSSSIH